MEFKIVTKDLTMMIEAKNRLEATRKWFAKVKEEIWKGKDTFEKIGHIANFVFEKEEDTIPFRTAPAFYAMGLLDEDTTVQGIANVCNCSKVEASVLLLEMLENDKKFIPKMSLSEKEVKKK